MLVGIWSWLLGLLIMLVLPIVLGEWLWRRFLDNRSDFDRKPGILPFALLFGLIGPPVGMAVFLLTASWLERDMPGSRPAAADMLIMLFFFSYIAGGVPALIGGGIMGALRKRMQGWTGVLGALVLGGVLALVCFSLGGRLGGDAQQAWRVILSGALGGAAAASIAYGAWRRAQDN
ncbi:hypothetical protein [Kerstersia sp.]|uniref:hypothetical protein n=1 Tax=Kerstersia sp. TaxID=1930783 RepID=UPI003F8E0756